jgi:hypothetical protein
LDLSRAAEKGRDVEIFSIDLRKKITLSVIVIKGKPLLAVYQNNSYIINNKEKI